MLNYQVKKLRILFIVAFVLLSSMTPIGAEKYESTDNTYKLYFDNNGVGYDANDPNSTDQNNTYLLSGSLESFDTGYGDTTTEYKIKTGLQPTFESNVAEVATLSNTDNTVGLYNKLLFTIDPNNNSTSADGAQFAVQISIVSDFSTFKYVNPSNFIPDNTTNSDLSVYYEPCAQTTNQIADNTRWDCGTVIGLKRYIKGLSANTTYYVRVVSLNGDFTNSEPGPSANATTQNSTLSLELSSNATSFGTLSNTNIKDSTPNIVVTATTNAENGYSVYIQGKGDSSSSQSGLYSASSPAKLISSTTGDLTVGQEGYGIQAVSVAGTPSIHSRWGVTGVTVGQLLTSSLLYFSSTTATTSVGDSVTTIHKASIAVDTKGATDYQDIITYYINANF